MKKIFFLIVLCLGIGQIVQAATMRVILDGIRSITQTTASAYITLQNDSSESILFTSGVCYSSTNMNPSISDSKFGGSGTIEVSANTPQEKTVSISGLTANTTYYIRAFMTSNALGKTFYGVVDTLKTPPYTSNALYFDGTNDYIAIPDNSKLDLTSDYTITAWVKPENFNYLAGIVSKYHTPATPSYVLRLGRYSPYQAFNFDEKNTSSNTLLTSNTWYHVAAVKSGTTRTLYVNGSAVSLTDTASFTPVANGDSLLIGLDYRMDKRFFNGLIDEVSIWSKALSQSEIQSGMSNGFSGSATNLVAYYKFDQGTPSGTNTSITTLNDASANGLTGYLRNMALTGSSSNFVTGVYLGPTVINKFSTTKYVKSITATGASVWESAYIQTSNTSSTTESHTYRYGVCWSSTNSNPTISNSTYQSQSAAHGTIIGNDLRANSDVVEKLGSLTSGTTYYTRVYLTIDNNTYYGDVISFKTLIIPTVTTSAVSSVGTTTATGNGNITDLGSPANVTAYGVCWSSTATTPTVSNSMVNNGTKTTTGVFTSSMTGLTPGTTYYVRAYATNSTGTAYGSVVTFKTLATPTITSAAVTNISTATATGNGNISNLGNPASVTAYGVCWSSSNKVPTISDGHVTNGSIATTGAFASSITGLSEKTTYYVRAYATNATGTSYGDTVKFTTTSILPTSISYTTPNSFPVGTAIMALSPAVVGGMPITGYSVSPALPAGLSINATTGIISGTPTAASVATNYTVTATNSGGSISTIVNITVTSTTKLLSVKAYLEGVWNGTNMNQCKDANATPVFTSAVDTVTVELHSSSSYSTIVYSMHGVYIGQDGNIYSGSLTYMEVPGSYSDSYYITVKTRNHLATTSASAVSFAGSSISYDFTTAASMAYGSNMKQLSTGIYGFYAGDVNQDGAIDATDGTMVSTLADNFTTGYLPEDLNGDGSVDGSDVSLVDNNDNGSISVSHP
ncbi:MAG: sialidase domain-containing protein [Paludibacteraceae bacterium]|nr:sialidase domain-containing protein [Paludibacteraceae bacterium]